MELSDELKTKLVPGNHPDGWETRSPSDLRPCGQCDGVVFLGCGVKLTPLPNGDVAPLPTASYETEALRYLRPMPVMWRAMQQARGSNQAGVSMPDINELLTNEIKTAAEKAQRPIRWLFTQDEWCIEAAHPKYRGRWFITNVAEGIWTVNLLPQQG